MVGLGLEDRHIPTFWLLLHVSGLWLEVEASEKGLINPIGRPPLDTLDATTSTLMLDMFPGGLALGSPTHCTDGRAMKLSVRVLVSTVEASGSNSPYVFGNRRAKIGYLGLAFG